MALATDLVQGEVILNGDIHGSADPSAPELTPTGVAAGQYVVPTLVVDEKGRVLWSADTEIDIDCATPSVHGPVIPGPHLTFNEGLAEVGLEVATTSTYGGIVAGVGFAIDVDGVLSVTGLPTTTAFRGSVIVPTSGNIDIDGSGNISIPVATGVSLGVVQAGSGLSVSSGIMFLDGSAYSLATDISTGVVQVGNGFDVDVAGVVSANINEWNATTLTKGLVQVGSNIDVASGVISVPAAAVGDKGVVEPGTGLGVAAGVLSIDTATNSTIGVVDSADTTHITIDGAGGVDVGPSVSVIDVASTFNAAIKHQINTITYAATVAPDLSLSNIQEITLTGDVTINAPTNGVDGGCYTFIIKQDGVGGHSVTLNTVYKTNGTTTTTSTANAVDILQIVRLSATEYVSYFTTDYK